jgi:hypothetical protein
MVNPLNGLAKKMLRIRDVYIFPPGPLDPDPGIKKALDHASGTRGKKALNSSYQRTGESTTPSIIDMENVFENNSAGDSPYQR